MLSRPLQYQSLKAVLQNMDANTRFRISLHMPAIRSVEKMLPLKMNYFKIRDRFLNVNDTSCTLGIFQHWYDGNAPQQIKADNSVGGSHLDFDKFGFSDSSGDNVLLPGDISFQRENRIEERSDTERIERMYRADLRIHEKALDILTDVKSKGITVNDYLKSLPPLPEDERFGDEYIIRQLLENFSEHLPRFIETDKYNLLPFECRRNNSTPPFTCYIQLTIVKGESRQIQRFEYTKKLYEAVKYFHEVLFGGRPMPIQVDGLDLTSTPSFDGPLRLPIGFRLRVHNAHVDYGTGIHKSFPMLVENSESLDNIWIQNCSEQEEFQSQVVQNAKRVVIPDVVEEDMQHLVRNLRDLPNLEISILSITSLSPEAYVSLIEAWLRGDRRVGASCWMRMGEEKTAIDVLKLVRTRHDWTERTKRCWTIPRSDSTTAEVFYASFKGARRDDYSRMYKWIMKIRIVKV